MDLLNLENQALYSDEEMPKLSVTYSHKPRIITQQVQQNFPYYMLTF